MKTNQLFLFVLISLFISCSDNHFRRFDTLPENQRWEASDKKVYEFEISDDAQRYNLVFQFSHVYGYQFNSFPLNISIQSPDGKIEESQIALQLKDESGKELAECSGDICDLYYKIKEKTKLQKGNYKITISHNFNGPYLPNVIGVGFAVENVKEK